MTTSGHGAGEPSGAPHDVPKPAVIGAAPLATVGAPGDVTDQRNFLREVADLAEHLGLALDAGGLGTWRWDMATGEVVWDARLEPLFGLEVGEFDGTFEAYVALLHPDDAATVLKTVEDAMRARARYTVDHRVLWADGTVHWLQGKGQVTVDDAGVVTGTIGCVAEITDQVLVAQERERSVAAALEAAENERVSAQRLEFLGSINDALAGANTREDVMHSVTRAAVPTLGEWCSIFLLPEPGGRVPDVEIAHADPEMVAYARELQSRFPYDPDATTGIPQVLRTGQSEFYPEIDEQVIDQADATEAARDVARSLRLRSAIAVPLLKQGRVIGALQLVNTDTSRVYTDQDLALAEAVASRIASTLENRRLGERQRVIAATLQASLLPESLPSIPGMDLAVRYWAAGEGTEVGGDFYDAFEVGHDHWAIVIGDVCGTGPEAAALTGLARHTIRALAWTGAGPQEVLRQLNRAVLRSDSQRFCTVLFCDLHRVSAGFRLGVTAGGHPLPIVHRADGRSETVGEPGTLIGILDSSTSRTHSLELQVGDTVVFYTDGVTDLPPPDDLDGQDMQDLVARASVAATSADEVAANVGEQVAAKVPLSARNDDIALLVLRVTAPA